MLIGFDDKKLTRTFNTPNGLEKTFGARARKLHQRLTELMAAENLAQMSKHPGARPHPYQGTRQGEFSIDISQPWRIIFRSNPPGQTDPELITAITIIGIEDPH